MDIHEKIRNGDYENTKPFPTSADFKAARNKYNEAEGLAATGLWQAKTKAYNDENNRLYAQFKKDLFAYLEITDHPKAEKLFALAWSHGHASGYSEVAVYADEFVELLRD
jgi:hypothetical protein